MYERFALSLAKTNKYEINIIGIAPKNKIDHPSNINFHFLIEQGRSFTNRIKNLIGIFQIWKSINPDLIIITSPDQVIPAVLHKRKSNCKIIFDIQEDYSKNITFQRIYRFPIRQILLFFLSLLNQLASKNVNHYLLAEKVYLRDLLPAISNKTIIENKTAGLPTSNDLHKSFTMLFSGTISEYTGIERAFNLYQELRKHIDLKFLIIGKCYSKELLEKIRKEVHSDTDIELIGGDHFVDHPEIVHHISSSHLGVICHEVNEVSKDRVPTKLFEYAFYGLPYLIQKGTEWENYSKTLGVNHIPIDFNNPSVEDLVSTLPEITKISNRKKCNQAGWSNEEDKLIALINELIDET